MLLGVTVDVAVLDAVVEGEGLWLGVALEEGDTEGVAEAEGDMVGVADGREDSDGVELELAVTELVALELAVTVGEALALVVVEGVELELAVAEVVALWEAVAEAVPECVGDALVVVEAVADAEVVGVGVKDVLAVGEAVAVGDGLGFSSRSRVVSPEESSCRRRERSSNARSFEPSRSKEWIAGPKFTPPTHAADELPVAIPGHAGHMPTLDKWTRRSVRPPEAERVCRTSHPSPVVCMVSMSEIFVESVGSFKFEGCRVPCQPAVPGSVQLRQRMQQC